MRQVSSRRHPRARRGLSGLGLMIEVVTPLTPTMVTVRLRKASLSLSCRAGQCNQHGVPGPLVTWRPLRPQLLAGGLWPVRYGHARTTLLRCERDLDFRRLLGAGRNEEIEKNPVRKVPGSNIAKLHLAPITRALVEPSGFKQKYLARRVLSVTAVSRPPFPDFSGEELERSARGQRQYHRLDDHRRASSSRRASAVSQKSSTKSRTLAKPCMRME